MAHSANHNSLIDSEYLPAAKHYYIAYSGGADSTALLHALSQTPALTDKITAIHINHQIQVDADAWAAHCEYQCQQLNIPIHIETVTPTNHSEDACRHARIEVFNRTLNQKDCLLTAHHLDDQAETIVFRLTRGTGLQGLTGIAITKKMPRYVVHRPLLHLKKSELLNYCSWHDLKYIVDQSNIDTNYSRNFIRHKVMPTLNELNSKAVEQIALTARNLNQSQLLLSSLIGAQNPLKTELFATPELLATGVYHWLNNLQQQPPSQKRLQQFAKDCMLAQADKTPELQLEQLRLFHWHNQIYALNHMVPNNANAVIQLDNNKPVNIKYGQLLLNGTQSVSIKVHVKYQQGFESLKISENSPNKKLKKLFQEHQIPTWIRAYLPYIYHEDELVAIGNNFQSLTFKTWLNDNSCELKWLSPQFLL